MIKHTIFLNAGHDNVNDPGAIYHTHIEAKMNIAIRDKLNEYLSKQFKVETVPDRLDLRESIIWVNERSSELDDGLAVSVHFNAGGGEGAETFYYDGGYEKSKIIAKTYIDKYCSLTGYKNRGAKPDTSARAGRLAWIRDTEPWAVLIECGFIDNEEDMKKFDATQIAYANYEAICDIYGIDPLKPIKPEPVEIDASMINKEEMKKQIIEFVNKF